MLFAITGCGVSESLERRDSFKRRLEIEQAALARYEAEHREWATGTIEKMKKLLDGLPAEAAELAKSKTKAEVDEFIAERKKELEVLTEEMESRLDAIKKKSAEIEETRRRLGEIESKLGLKPSAVE